jgi:glycerol-1-phosphate dehydrogenase [NAD(P)+]
MSTAAATPVPVGDFDAVLDYLRAVGPDGGLAPCGLRRAVLGPDVLPTVADEVAALLGRPAGDASQPAAVTLLVDDTPIAREGVDVKAEVTRLLDERFRVRTQVLTDPHPPLHVDERALATATQAARGADVLVSVGGGTITDIAKMASVGAGGLPHVVVQTAASVDGFTDDVSVVLRNGVKRTVPSRWPDVVLADTRTVREAPPAMNRAGLGELTSMFTAPADWRLARLLDVDGSYKEASTVLLASVGEGLAQWSPGLATAELTSVERLTWALVVRGVVTGVSGSTAVLSGVEHLVSHMLDLHAAGSGLPTGLHGAQVGVAAVVAAAAWELLRERLAAGAPDPRCPDPDTARTRVEQAFGHLGPAVVEECWRDYSAKLARWADRLPVVRAVLGDWADHEADLARLVRPSAEIRAALTAGGAPARFADLDPAVPPELGRWAVRHCALMRDRTTVVDLLTVLGWWEPDDADEVLQRTQQQSPTDTVQGGSA